MKRENQSYLNILSWKAKRNLVEKQLGKIPMKEQLQFQFARENKTILFKLCHRNLHSTTSGMKAKNIIIFSKFPIEITLRYMVIRTE